MTWKIRSKTAFTYEFGHHRYIVPKFKPVPFENMNETPIIQVKSDIYCKVRSVHNYRNISRACKQFLLGDPVAEQYMLNILRIEFLWPLRNIKSPISNYTPIQRMLADHTDRHYSLVANNQHPMQLNLYEFLNKRYRKVQDLKNYKEGKAEPTFEIALEEKVEQLIEEKLKTKDVQNGENLNVEEISEIYREANMIVREKMNLKLNTRGKTGEVEDYLEIRRPLHQGKQI